MGRLLQLLMMAIRSGLNRLRYDWARELVVFVSGGVVMVTFGFIINDFLNVQVSALSTVMRDRFATPIAGLLFLAVAIKAGSMIKKEWGGLQSVTRMAESLGEGPRLRRSFIVAYSTIVMICWYSAALYVAQKYLIKTSQAHEIWAIIVMLPLTAVSFWVTRASKKVPEMTSRLTSDKQESRMTNFVRWRLIQLFLRNRASKTALIMSVCIYLLLFPLQANGIPFFASVACTILASIFGTCSIYFQLAEDLNYAWAERTMAVSHEEFCRGYQRISFAVAILLALIAATVFIIASLASGHPIALQQTATLAVISASSAIVAPMMMFQIDGRRPIVNITLLTICAMFIGTAIFASWIAVILVPLLGYFAQSSQKGRFYRA